MVGGFSFVLFVGWVEFDVVYFDYGLVFFSKIIGDLLFFG